MEFRKTPEPAEPNWLRLANHLARRALRYRPALPRGEVRSLARLAVAQARADYDPGEATCPLGVFVCTSGWLRLMSLLRDERAQRRLDRHVKTFTDLGAQAALRGEDDGVDNLLPPSRPICPPDWLDHLTPTQRRLVRLRLEGASLTEMARALGHSRQWVIWQMRQLRAHVSCLLAEGDPPAGRTEEAGATATGEQP